MKFILSLIIFSSVSYASTAKCFGVLDLESQSKHFPIKQLASSPVYHANTQGFSIDVFVRSNNSVMLIVENIDLNLKLYSHGALDHKGEFAHETKLDGMRLLVACQR
jgi:hypothetical protein